MVTEVTVILNEVDVCAIRDAFKNNPDCIDAAQEFLGKKVCDDFVKKLKQSVLLTIPNNPFSALFFGSLAKAELMRLKDDSVTRCSETIIKCGHAVVVCRHTAQNHIDSLAFIIDSLDCVQS